jgi:hypothetical protein
MSISGIGEGLLLNIQRNFNVRLDLARVTDEGVRKNPAWMVHLLPNDPSIS